MLIVLALPHMDMLPGDKRHNNNAGSFITSVWKWSRKGRTYNDDEGGDEDKLKVKQMTRFVQLKTMGTLSRARGCESHRQCSGFKQEQQGQQGVIKSWEEVA
ncbi:hypothetical protein BU17DRAFT_67647 [Hysterangium stoloniferum]|nr:hypothetical protein BU17DRAFT_67647 [Hysterangium stoloniferum]